MDAFGRNKKRIPIVLEDLWKDFEGSEVLLAGTKKQIPIVLEDFWKDFGGGGEGHCEGHCAPGFLEGF